MTRDHSERPNVIPWPPILYLASAIAAYALSLAAPLDDPFRLLLGHVSFFIGLALSAAGLGLVVWALIVMLRHKTNIAPNRAATRLVSHGPFRYTRNPIYLGDTIILVGLGLVFSNLWFLAAAFLAGALTHYLVILREEKHLAARFGREWERYRASVPRWAGWRARVGGNSEI